MTGSDSHPARAPAPLVEVSAQTLASGYWADLATRWELLRALVERDLALRYRQTVIGVAWVVLQPLSVMVLLTVVFSTVARLPSPPGIPYALVVLSALAPWQFFSAAVTNAGVSLVQHSNLVTKVYFPRLLVPMAAVVGASADLVVSTVLVLIGTLIAGLTPGVHLLLLPLFMFPLFLATAGAGCAFAGLTAQFRDFRYVVPFLIQFGLYATPVGYSLEFVPEALRLWFALNPLVGVIEGFRWCLFGGQTGLDLPVVLISSLSATCIGVAGLILFRRTEARFADAI